MKPPAVPPAFPSAVVTRDRTLEAGPDPELLHLARARIGSVLRGRYRLDAILGVGGMATVYAATHRNRAQLAVKILHPPLCADPSVRERFFREAWAANSVVHPAVVRVVDDDVTDDGAAFLVMERLVGTEVEALWRGRGGTLGVHASVAIVARLLDVLGAAHAAGVVHRDIKPSNLFVSTEGELKVFDFGIARTREALASAMHLTGACMIAGTPGFMAPEQATGGMVDVDERTDLWAAGATLFALVSGRTVHEGATAGDWLVRATRPVSRSLVEVAPRVPQAIGEVVDVALAFEKKDRWQSAAEMRLALLAAYRFHYRRAPSRDTLVALAALAAGPSAPPSPLCAPDEAERARDDDTEVRDGEPWRGLTTVSARVGHGGARFD